MKNLKISEYNIYSLGVPPEVYKTLKDLKDFPWVTYRDILDIQKELLDRGITRRNTFNYTAFNNFNKFGDPEAGKFRISESKRYKDTFGGIKIGKVIRINAENKVEQAAIDVICHFLVDRNNSDYIPSNGKEIRKIVNAVTKNNISMLIGEQIDSEEVRYALVQIAQATEGEKFVELDMLSEVTIRNSPRGVPTAFRGNSPLETIEKNLKR